MKISDSNGKKYKIEHPPFVRPQPIKESIRKEKLTFGKAKKK